MMNLCLDALLVYFEKMLPIDIVLLNCRSLEAECHASHYTKWWRIGMSQRGNDNGAAAAMRDNRTAVKSPTILIGYSDNDSKI